MVRGRGGLKEFAEARAGIGEAPGGQFDAKRFKRFEDFLTNVGFH